MAESDKIMFEVYREAGYGRKFRVVYFTELDEHNKEAEIARATAGEHVFDGFISAHGAGPAKAAISRLLDHLNGGETVSPERITTSLAGHLVP